MKTIIITGAHSYIGESFRRYLEPFPDSYRARAIAARGLIPTPETFVGADVVFCVAGIAHVRETAENRRLYFDVNQNLVVAIAEAAKAAGVGQFILLSSMSVYGLDVGRITKRTEPRPVTAYGESKLRADEAIRKLEGDGFLFTCLRPPMVYGKDCAGNYQTLRKFALKSPAFPDYKNQRSMIYVGNLCEFVKECIDFERGGLFFPQNAEYVSTSEMAARIAAEHGKKIRLTKAFNWALKVAPVRVVKKAFGDLTYEKTDAVGKYGFAESVRLTERG